MTKDDFLAIVADYPVDPKTALSNVRVVQALADESEYKLRKVLAEEFTVVRT